MIIAVLLPRCVTIIVSAILCSRARVKSRYALNNIDLTFGRSSFKSEILRKKLAKNL